MLARRFTVVCTMITIFGMGLAILVAEASRLPRIGDQTAPATCLFEAPPACGDMD